MVVTDFKPEEANISANLDGGGQRDPTWAPKVRVRKHGVTVCGRSLGESEKSFLRVTDVCRSEVNWS